jgi:protein TonB
MMASAYSSSAYRASRRGRGPGVVLAIGANILLALLFLTMSSYAPFSRMAPTGLSVFNVSGSRAAPEATEKKAARQPRRTKRSATTPKTTTPPPPKPPAPDASAPTPFKIMVVSKEVFAASDIGKLPKSGPPAPAGEAANSAESASTYGPGEGPGGATLYAAEWYRKPRHAELAYYLPAVVSEGSWAEIACQTVEDYRVENCRTLAESPRGSGLANALRRAAWQFRVRPPRIDGKPMLHTWVRIHFDFTQKAPG